MIPDPTTRMFGATSADVIPFPRARRRALIWRQASWYAEQPQRAAEKNLAYQLQVQAQTLLNRGVAPAIVEAEVRALEGAIRAAIWRAILTPGRGA